MKKLIFILITFFALTINVKADNLTTSMSGISNINALGSFSITINVSGNNISALSMNLSYDKSKLELTSYKGQNGFTATVGSRIVLDSTSEHSGNFKAVILTFKAKESFTAGQNTIISVSNVAGAINNGSTLITGTSSSKTITVNIPKSSNNNLSRLSVDGTSVSNFNRSVTSYDLGTTTNTSISIDAQVEDSKASITGTGKRNINYGVNKFNVTVTAENGTKKTYSIKITRPDPRSSNNTLSSLSISPLEINFAKDKTNYVYTVENSVDSINIVAKTSDTKAKVSGTGIKKLNDYANVFKVNVTAENGNVRVYSITVNRKDKNGNLGNLSSNNNLSAISIEGFEINFEPDITNYTLEVDNSVKNIVINAKTQDSKATLTIDNIEELKVGNNNITITVNAENGDTKIYNINVIRKENIPITKLDNLEETISNTDKNQIIVEIRDNSTILTNEMIKSIKEAKKEVIINKYDANNNIIYSWKIDGNSINETTNINTNIKFNSNNFDAISELTNYADAVYLNFEHSGNLPTNTKIKIYVADRYKDGDLVNIYYFNEKTNKMEKIELEIQVVDGYVEFTIDHCSEYIITRSLLNNQSTNIFMILLIIENVLLICSIPLFLFFLKHRKFKKYKSH